MSRWKTYVRADLNRTPLSPGVYAIYVDSELIYVGQAMKIRNRLRAHALSGLISATRPVIVKVRVCRRAGEWLMREYRLIARLKPEGNTRFAGSKTQPDAPEPVLSKQLAGIYLDGELMA